MSHQSALLAAIIDRPHDDNPRLVYADLLEEAGGESNTARAEFIRVQIALAGNCTASMRRHYKSREKELADRWAWEWAAPLHKSVYGWVFRRGFIEKVSTNLQTTAEDIRELLNKAPIRTLRDESQLDELEGVVDALPFLAKLKGLEFWGLYGFDDRLMRKMLTSHHLSNLGTLILFHDRNGNLVDDDVLIEGLRHPARAKTRYLGVNIDDAWRGPSQAVLRAMIDSPYLRQVRKIKLSHTRLDAELVSQLLHSMPRLDRLDLHESVATTTAWNMLLERARAGKFKWLRLREARVSEYATQQGNHYGQPLANELRAAFDRAPVHIDWESDWIQPMIGGCWRGYTWYDLRRREHANFDRFLRGRDFDGLESYFRNLCRRFRGDRMTAEIDARELSEFTELLAARLRKVDIPEQALSLQVDVRPESESEAVPGWILTRDPGDDFIPDEQRFDGEIIGQFSGPIYPGDVEKLSRDRNNPLDPWSGPLFMYARRVASVARAASLASLPIPLIMGPWHHRVW